MDSGGGKGRSWMLGTKRWTDTVVAVAAAILSGREGCWPPTCPLSSSSTWEGAQRPRGHWPLALWLRGALCLNR